MMTMGISRVSSSSFSRRQAVKPSMTGIITSSRIRSGGSAATRSSASCPLRALMVRWPELLAVDDRDHDDGDVAGRGVRLQLVEHLPAVPLRHHDVERDGERPEFPRFLEALVAAEGPDHPISRLGEVLLEEVDHVRVVVDGEDQGLALGAGWLVVEGLRRG